jgi:magnesium-transporting ATPase (P-type)
MLLAILFWGRAPLMAIQLLLINVVADGVPDLCICREPLEDDAMKRKPINKNASLFADGLGIRISVVAALFAITSLIAYYLGRFVSISPDFAPSHEIGMTMAYVAVGWSSVVNIMNVRSYNKSLFKIGLLSNPLLFCGIIFSLTLVFVTAFVPFGANMADAAPVNIFYCTSMSLNHWLIMIAIGISPIPVVEIQKFFIRRKNRTA